MKCFLTSDPLLPTHDALNPANGLADRLLACVPSPCRALYLCSDPAGWEKTDHYGGILKACLERAGLAFSRFTPLDGRNERQAAALVGEADFLILAGGHVPTQNRFFQQIGLKALLRGFEGVLLGISAGSMNCAGTVYAHPEREGEALDPAYRRFLPGLGLTALSILPHYRQLRNETLDGLRVLEDIAYPDSLDRSFLLLPDGSYLLLADGNETLFGEGFLLEKASLRQLSAEGEVLAL